jgi:hypothetical protein
MDKILPIYDITIDDPNAEEELGIEQIAFVKNPAIKVKGVAFSAHTKKVVFKDGVKMRIAAPALIPSVIYRNDEDGQYNVRFTEEEIEKIYQKFMQSLQTKKDVFNIEHTSETVPAYVLEAMLVDSANKQKFIKQEYNIDIPKGSVFVVSQITDEEYYNQIVENDQTSYSIEGFLSLVKLTEHQTNKNKEEMKKQNFMLPDGEWEIEGKIYVVKDGEVLEVKDKAPEVEIEAEEEKKEEEVAMESEKKEEEVVMETEEEVKEEEMEEVKEEEKQYLSQEEVEKMIEEKLAEKMEEMSEVLADLKLKLEEVSKEEEKVEMTQLSAHEIRTQKALAFHKAFGNKW